MPRESCRNPLLVLVKVAFTNDSGEGYIFLMGLCGCIGVTELMICTLDFDKHLQGKVTMLEKI